MRYIALYDWSWFAVISTVWELKRVLEERHPNIPWGMLQGSLGLETIEVAIRKRGNVLKKMTPNLSMIAAVFVTEGGTKSALDEMWVKQAAGNEVDRAFAEANGNADCNWGADAASSSEFIYILSKRLPSRDARQRFQRIFFEREFLEHSLTEEDRKVVAELELWVGCGIFAAIANAKRVLPDLDPEILAAHCLKKYGTPVGEPVSDPTQETFGCSWCNTDGCECGGGKAEKRKVTLEDAMHQLHRGPRDTQRAMRMGYARGNDARAGFAYGPLRWAIEVYLEGATACLLEEVKGSEAALRDRLGPFLLQTPRLMECLARVGDDHKEDRQSGLLGELADAIHWAWLLAPQLDHCRGLEAAMRLVANWCEVDLGMPTMPDF